MKNYCKRKIVLLAVMKLLLVLGFVPVAEAAGGFPKPGNMARGAKLWANNCGRCHNIRSAQDLRDDQWVTTAFHMRVRAGLTGQDTRDILTFLQSTNSSGVAAPAPSAGTADTNEDSSDKKDGGSVQASLPAGNAGAGKALFAENCAACHGADGRGGDISGVPNLSTRMGKSNATLTKHIKQGFQTPGSAMAMPPWPDLSNAEIRSLLAYLRSSLG